MSLLLAWIIVSGSGLFIAILAALAFLPVEQGFAAAYLPSGDWHRFPIMGIAK